MKKPRYDEEWGVTFHGNCLRGDCTYTCVFSKYIDLIKEIKRHNETHEKTERLTHIE